MRNINAAAAVTPVNLIATVLLATPRQLLPEEDLLAQIDLYLRLLRRLPYSSRVTVTTLSSAEILTYGFALRVLVREESSGPVIGLAPGQAALMPYYCNNVLHLFALPSLLACCFIATRAWRRRTCSAWHGASIPTSRRSCSCAGTRTRSRRWSSARCRRSPSSVC